MQNNQPNYRYLLTRNTSVESSRSLLVCMLNPSTADEETNDPTISRVTRLTQNSGFGQLLVLNLLGIRATKPIEIWKHKDPIGEENFTVWNTVLKSLDSNQDTIALAWGRTPKSNYQLSCFIPALVKAKNSLKQWKKPLKTWVKNLDGSPRHPLYINTQTELIDYDFDAYLNDLFKKYSEFWHCDINNDEL